MLGIVLVLLVPSAMAMPTDVRKTAASPDAPPKKKEVTTSKIEGRFGDSFFCDFLCETVEDSSESDYDYPFDGTYFCGELCGLGSTTPSTTTTSGVTIPARKLKASTSKPKLPSTSFSTSVPTPPSTTQMTPSLITEIKPTITESPTPLPSPSSEISPHTVTKESPPAVPNITDETSAKSSTETPAKNSTSSESEDKNSNADLSVENAKASTDLIASANELDVVTVDPISTPESEILLNSSSSELDSLASSFEMSTVKVGQEKDPQKGTKKPRRTPAPDFSPSPKTTSLRQIELEVSRQAIKKPSLKEVLAPFLPELIRLWCDWREHFKRPESVAVAARLCKYHDATTLLPSALFRTVMNNDN